MPVAAARIAPGRGSPGREEKRVEHQPRDSGHRGRRQQGHAGALPPAPPDRFEQMVGERRHHGDREDRRGGDRKRLRVGERGKQLALLVGQGEHGEKGDDRVGNGRDDRRADLASALLDTLVVALGTVVLGQPAIDVLRHDQGHVGHVADGDRQAGQRHDVRIDAQQVHRQKRDGHRQGERADNRQGAAEVEEEHEHDQAADDQLLGQGLLERADRFANNRRPVVKGNDPDLRDAPVSQDLFRHAG